MITFDRNTHTYRCDGVRVPSVTQILKWLYPNKYAGVPEETLNAAAEFGNRMHEWIEAYATDGTKKRGQTDYMKLSTTQVVELICNHQFQAESCEQIVSWKNRFAGTYDMVGLMEADSALVDIKCTAQLDEDYLSWQLGMYKIALQEEGKKISKCYCLWVPKGGLAKFVEILPKTEEEIDWLVFRYEQEHYSE